MNFNSIEFFLFSGVHEGTFFGQQCEQEREDPVTRCGYDPLFLEGDIEKNEDPDKANTEEKRR